MAAAGLREELTCAVCLGLYQDPVTLPCQHSFCAKCIGDVWDHSESMCGVNCPECRRTFNPRPSLVKNHTLQNIVEKYSQCHPTAPAARPSPVMCDNCIDSPSPAVKTCLKCETSFCSHHLQPHLTKQVYKDHGLIEPIADFTTRQCPTHKKVIEFYCEQDEECVCMSCTVIGKHKSHSLLSLEVGQEKVKGILKNKFENLRKVQKDWSSEQQDLKQSEMECKRFSKELKEKLSATFSEWRKQLEEDEKSSLEMIDEEMQRVLSQITSNSESLLKKMEDMKIIEKEVQDQEQKDPLSFLQDAKQLLSRYSQFQTSKTTVTQQDKIPLKSNSHFGSAFQGSQGFFGQTSTQPVLLPVSTTGFGCFVPNSTGNSEQRTQGLQINSQPVFRASAIKAVSLGFGGSPFHTTEKSEQRTQGSQINSQPVFGAPAIKSVSLGFGGSTFHTTQKSEQRTQGSQINSQPVFRASAIKAVSLGFGGSPFHTTEKSEQRTQGSQINSQPVFGAPAIKSVSLGFGGSTFHTTQKSEQRTQGSQINSQPVFGAPAIKSVSLGFGGSTFHTTQKSEQRTQGSQINSQPVFGPPAIKSVSLGFGGSTFHTTQKSEQRTQGSQINSQPVFGALASCAVSTGVGGSTFNTIKKSEQRTQGPQINSTSQRKCHSMNLSNIASIVQKNFNKYQKYQTTIMNMLRRFC